MNITTWHYRTIIFAFFLTFGCLNLMACESKSWPWKKTPTPTATTEVVTIEPTNTPYAPLKVTPTMTSEPQSFYADLQASAMPSPSERKMGSAAILFLLDRSETMVDLCGENASKTASKEIPEFIFTILKHDPALTDVDISIGMGTFPFEDSDSDDNEYSSDGSEEGSLIYSLHDVWAEEDSDWWFESIDRAWNSPVVDSLGFFDAVKAGVSTLKASKAENKHLVVISDGLLKVSEYSSEWEDVQGINTENGKNLAETLKSEGVRLNYVLVDCAPNPDEDEVKAELYKKNLDRWVKVDGFSKKAVEPFAEDQFVKVYGRTEYLIDPYHPLSIPEVIQQLIGNIVPDYLPVAVKDRLWSQKRVFLGISQDPEELKFPIPGFADNVSVHVITLDNELKPKTAEGVPGFDLDEDDDYLRSYSTELHAPLEHCMGWFLSFTKAPDSPSIVWWEFTERSFRTVEGEINNDINLEQPGVQLSNPKVEGKIIGPSDGYDGTDEFKENCFRVAVRKPLTPGEEEIEMPDFYDENDPFSIEFGLDELTEAFLMDLEVVLFKIRDIPGEDWVDALSDFLIRDDDGTVYQKLATGDIQIGHGAEDAVMYSTYFIPQPTLQNAGDDLLECDTSGDRKTCALELEVAYLAEELYSDRDVLEPLFYLLASQRMDSCDAVIDQHFTNADGTKWYSYFLSGLDTEDFQYSLSAANSEFAIEISDPLLSLLDTCGFEYLIIYWEDEPDWTQIECFLVDGTCSQHGQFTYNEDG